MEVKPTSSRIAVYMTEDHVVPLVFYYSGAFVTDGAILLNNSEGRYEYGSILQETRLFLYETLPMFRQKMI